MLNGDDNENGSKSTRSNQQKTKLHVQYTFSSNQQKPNLHEQHAFLSFPCRCFARLQRCFVRLKRQLPSYTLFLWRNFRMCLPSIFFPDFPVFMFAFNFHCRSFSSCWLLLAGRQHFSFSHRRFEFPCFPSYEIRLLCFQ